MRAFSPVNPCSCMAVTSIDVFILAPGGLFLWLAFAWITLFGSGTVTFPFYHASLEKAHVCEMKKADRARFMLSISPELRTITTVIVLLILEKQIIGEFHFGNTPHSTLVINEPTFTQATTLANANQIVSVGVVFYTQLLLCPSFAW